MASVTAYPGTGQSLGSGAAWTTPENIGSDNGAEANTSTTGLSDELTGTNFGFAIPGSATINGIILEIQRRHTDAGGNCFDVAVKLKKTAGAVGDNKANVNEWATTDEIITYGGSSDLWGTTWTPAEINSADFGAYMTKTYPNPAGDSYVDFMRITVHYTKAGGALFFAQL